MELQSLILPVGCSISKERIADFSKADTAAIDNLLKDTNTVG